MDTVPTKIDDWYTQAINFKTQWDRADAVAHRKPYNPYPTQKNNTHTQQVPKVDPYAMDVDAVKLEKLTSEERERCFKEGRCLQCRKPRHFMKDCTTFTEKPFLPERPQEKPKHKRVAVVEEDEEELKDLAEEMEELTVGKVMIQDL